MGKIGLTGGPGRVLTWTRHALERLGYEVTGGGNKISVEVISGDQGLLWKVRREEVEKVLSSIHGLSRFLIQDK